MGPVFTRGGVLLLLLGLQSACVAGRPLAHHSVSLSPRADAVRVSDIEFNEALTALVLEMPLLSGHKGTHSEAYHRTVFATLDDAMRGCITQQACATKLRSALKDLAVEISRAGSRINRLLTQ